VVLGLFIVPVLFIIFQKLQEMVSVKLKNAVVTHEPAPVLVKK